MKDIIEEKRIHEALMRLHDDLPDGPIAKELLPEGYIPSWELEAALPPEPFVTWLPSEVVH